VAAIRRVYGVSVECLEGARPLVNSFKYKNKMQRYRIFFITVNAVHVSGGFSANHQELKTVHTAYGICQACLLLPLAVATSKLDIWAENPPETCRALTVIRNIV
jgi:hypothetical protein